jgi:hypothetical protein
VQEHVRCALDSLEISGRVKVESDVHQRLLSTMSDGREHVASRPGIEVMDLLPDSVQSGHFVKHEAQPGVDCSKVDGQILLGAAWH